MTSPTPSHRCDIAIAGGGPVGLTLALALAQHGHEVVVADAAPPPGEGPADARAWFIAYGCWRIFRALGLEDEVLVGAEPVTQVDAEGRIGGISFIAEDSGEPVLGYMVEAAGLVAALHAAVAAEKRVTILSRARIESVTFGDPCAILKLADGEIHAPLVVGCDGARSLVRRQAGLRFEGHDYDAAAVSTTVKLARPHNGAARQVFLPNGPMAVLP
ncbi:MAG: FAD-dependent oxidoreductase, partial [Verrucomicrobia bacterium]|nr:FAD-dependent oxidoreductase [Verrucomicrobiota bacterium]